MCGSDLPGKESAEGVLIVLEVKFSFVEVTADCIAQVRLLLEFIMGSAVPSFTAI